MVFSSLIFIFIFLPFTLFSYYSLSGKKQDLKNYILLFFSIVFYFYGEPKLIYILFISLIGNYIFGLMMDKPYKKIALIFAVLLNISNLVFFKYTNFIIKNINLFFGSDFSLLKIIMPIGISFYTFQAMSYVIDCYRNEKLIQKNPFYVFLYVTMFPQLIAGPIVRYEDVALQIKARDHNFDKFSSGIDRFTQGIAKKVLLANAFAPIADHVFGLGMKLDSTPLAWMGAIAYTLQIYYDFSGYSDMAIGLGRMFGFEFLENFNYPYISRSITEFWRRWHISLSTWFKDYVYIPLGGNRVKFSRQIFNILSVWMLTGFWHGAEWNFIIWGLYFGVLLIFEKRILSNFLNKHRALSHLYALLLIVIGWVIFRAESIEHILKFIKIMFSFNMKMPTEGVYYLSQYKYELIFGIIFSIPIIHKFKNMGSIMYIKIVLELFIFILVVMTLLQSSFNPFIYFRF